MERRAAYHFPDKEFYSRSGERVERGDKKRFFSEWSEKNL